MTHPHQRDGRENDTRRIQVSAPDSLCSLPLEALTSKVSETLEARWKIIA